MSLAVHLDSRRKTTINHETFGNDCKRGLLRAGVLNHDGQFTGSWVPGPLSWACRLWSLHVKLYWEDKHRPNPYYISTVPHLEVHASEPFSFVCSRRRLSSIMMKAMPRVLASWTFLPKIFFSSRESLTSSNCRFPDFSDSTGYSINILEIARSCQASDLEPNAWHFSQLVSDAGNCVVEYLQSDVLLLSKLYLFQVCTNPRCSTRPPRPSRHHNFDPLGSWYSLWKLRSPLDFVSAAPKYSFTSLGNRLTI